MLQMLQRILLRLLRTLLHSGPCGTQRSHRTSRADGSNGSIHLSKKQILHQAAGYFVLVDFGVP